MSELSPKIITCSLCPDLEIPFWSGNGTLLHLQRAHREECHPAPRMDVVDRVPDNPHVPMTALDLVEFMRSVKNTIREIEVCAHYPDDNQGWGEWGFVTDAAFKSGRIWLTVTRI